MEVSHPRWRGPAGSHRRLDAGRLVRLDDGQWRPIACAFEKDGGAGANGVKLRVGRLFEGIIDKVRIYNREIGAPETAALFGGTDPSALDWQRRYFASTPDDWATDEDGNSGALWRQSVRGGQPFIADSPVMQLIPQITVNHREVRFNRRIVGAHPIGLSNPGITGPGLLDAAGWNGNIRQTLPGPSRF